MFPLSDDDSRIRKPAYINWALLALNIVVFLYEISLGADSNQLQQFIMRWGSIPEFIGNGQRLETLFTSMFLHGGWAHLIGNMTFLWVFGNNIEDRFGHIPYLIFYLVTGLAASAAHIFLSLGTSGANIPSVGASGAISGVLGAYIVLFGMNRVKVLLGYAVATLPAWTMIGLWAGQQFIATYASIANTEQSDGVAYAAHAGGFIAGVALAFVIKGMFKPSDQTPMLNRR